MRHGRRSIEHRTWGVGRARRGDGMRAHGSGSRPRSRLRWLNARCASRNSRPEQQAITTIAPARWSGADRDECAITPAASARNPKTAYVRGRGPPRAWAHHRVAAAGAASTGCERTQRGRDPRRPVHEAVGAAAGPRARRRTPANTKASRKLCFINSARVAERAGDKPKIQCGSGWSRPADEEGGDGHGHEHGRGQLTVEALPRGARRTNAKPAQAAHRAAGGRRPRRRPRQVRQRGPTATARR